MTTPLTQFITARFCESRRLLETIDYPGPTAEFSEGRFGAVVMVYEPHLNMLKARYGSDQAENPVKSITFEFTESGCGSFNLTMNKPPQDLNIDRMDRIDIHLMGANHPCYSGHVDSVPTVNTGGSITYSGFGYFDILGTILVDKTYQGQTLENVVKDLAAELGNTFVEFFPDQISPIGYTTQHLRFDRVTLKDAFKTVAELAQQYVFGVDHNRQFFFRPVDFRSMISSEARLSHWIGNSIEDFELSEANDSVVNKLYVKIGEIEDGSNYADFSVTDLDSISFFGERAKTVSAPEIKSAEEAELWAEYKVSEDAWPEIACKVKHLNIDGYFTNQADLILPGDYLRVSAPRAGLIAPYYEPLNGYFRYRDLDMSNHVVANGWLKLAFTARASGKLGRIQIFGQKKNSPGSLYVRLKQNSVVLATSRIYSTEVPEWYGWITADFDDAVQVYQGVEYEIEIYESGSSSFVHRYDLLGSTHDQPYSGALYVSNNSGATYAENILIGLFYRAFIVHADEYRLPVKKAKYSVDPDSGIRVDLDLGAVDQPLETRILSLLRDLKQESLLQQSNVADLS